MSVGEITKAPTKAKDGDWGTLARQKTFREKWFSHSLPSISQGWMGNLAWLFTAPFAWITKLQQSSYPQLLPSGVREDTKPQPKALEKFLSGKWLMKPQGTCLASWTWKVAPCPSHAGTRCCWPGSDPVLVIYCCLPNDPNVYSLKIINIYYILLWLRNLGVAWLSGCCPESLF